MTGKMGLLSETLTFDTRYVLCLFLNTAPIPSDPQPPDRAAERFAMLRELADIGMEMARALQGEVRARAEAIDPDEPPKGVAELSLPVTSLPTPPTLPFPHRGGRVKAADS
jgi:hypothetical protein